MTDQDRADKDAESLLPNAWWARPAVATALRERDEHWTQINDRQRMSDAAYYTEMINQRDQEIERLKATAIDLAEVTHRQDMEIERLKAENAARLEALETIAKWEFNFRGDCVADARRVAQAEIDRAKGEKA